MSGGIRQLRVFTAVRWVGYLAIWRRRQREFLEVLDVDSQLLLLLLLLMMLQCARCAAEP